MEAVSVVRSPIASPLPPSTAAAWQIWHSASPEMGITVIVGVVRNSYFELPHNNQR
jgi:hypothetical protein